MQHIPTSTDSSQLGEGLFDFTIIGGGIVGVATAWFLIQRFPEAKIVLLEKEAELAHHQTGHNSGVIHSGIYYTPGSLKAQFAREGAQAMASFCARYNIPYEICGKVIVATKPSELPRLEALYQRGLENKLAVERLSIEGVREHEPNVKSLGGLHVPSTGIVNYRTVCQVLAQQFKEAGGQILLNAPVTQIKRDKEHPILTTPLKEIRSQFLINCAGLFSDRVAKLAGHRPKSRIIPFRGEYFDLVPEKRHWVQNLIYPVPNPSFPFLGVHLTRGIESNVHAGPNAVLSMKREGYKKWDFNLKDSLESLSYPGLLKLMMRYPIEGSEELLRSWFKPLFVKSLQQLVPQIQAEDLVASPAGVRAQALYPDGRLVDDFLIVEGSHDIHIYNAPSPAATASLAIGKTIANKIPKQQHLREATLPSNLEFTAQ